MIILFCQNGLLKLNEDMPYFLLYDTIESCEV